MSTDVQKICDALAQMHEVWASAVEIAVATWLLSQQISYALLGPIVVTILPIMGTTTVSKYIGPAMGTWMAAVQTRVGATAKVLQSMKEVKMLGLSPTICNVIRKLRNNEIAKSMKSRRLLAAVITFGNVASALGPATAFIIYVTAAKGDEVLDVPRAFTTLSLISLLSGPVSTLIFSFPPLLEALACVARIQKYLLAEERVDHRVSDTHDEISATERITMEGDDTELRTIRPKPSDSSFHRPIVRLQCVSLAWQHSGPAAVNQVSIDLPQQSMTFIVGPVGCGKSTLLKGILGELAPKEGIVTIHSRRTAFVDQNPWVQNDSVRNNIIGPDTYDDGWYQTVTHACALDDDIAGLPQRDLTVVGSAGSSLSGGQKLRLALARAVYAHPSLLMLDDCFSGIDPRTEDAIFTRLFGKRGLLRRLGVTVVLSTHAAHRLSYSDRIIALSAGGRIVEDGSFQDLMASGGYVASLFVRHRQEEDNNIAADGVNGSASNKQADSSAEEKEKDSPTPRIMGDRQVYKHYFSAAGWLQSALFFVLIFMFAFFTRFSGMTKILAGDEYTDLLQTFGWCYGLLQSRTTAILSTTHIWLHSLLSVSSLWSLCSVWRWKYSLTWSLHQHGHYMSASWAQFLTRLCSSSHLHTPARHLIDSAKTSRLWTQRCPCP